MRIRSFINCRSRKIILLCFVFILSVASSFAQLKLKDLADGKTKLMFYGYDFTQARFIGTASFTDAGGMKDYFIPEWNKLIFLEPRKYSLQPQTKLKPDKYSANTDMIAALNKTIDVKSRIIDVPYTLTDDQARKSLEQYRPDEKEGIACSFVVESLDRKEEKITAWVIFFDLSTMQVILSERMEGKTGGIGLRNYYGSGFANITNKIGGKFKTWTTPAK